MVSQPTPDWIAASMARRTARAPSRWPAMRGSRLDAAQRPLPSMMMATCVGNASDGPGTRGLGATLVATDIARIRPSDLTDVLFLLRQRHVHLLDVCVSELLHLAA